MKYFWVTIAVMSYTVIWIACICMIFGLLMPNPAKFGRAISGSNRKKQYKKPSTTKTSIEKDDYLFYETIDD